VEEELSAMDAQSQDLMLATIREKEERAERLLKEAKISCEILKQETRQKQEDLLKEAQEQAEAMKTEAREAGHSEGLAAGREEGIAQIREEQKQLLLDANAKAEQTLNAARAEMETYVQEAEKQIVTIVMEVADKILPQHFIDVPQVILPLVRKALLKVRDQSQIVIHVCPESYDMVLMAKAEFQSLLEGNSVLTVKSDESLANGDCVIETPNGTVDARLATQLELIKKSVQDVMQ
jgi:flagellar assembly protein FliH